MVCDGITGEVQQSLEYLPSGHIFRSENYGMQPYMFCGKELITMHGLNQYDSNARFQHYNIPRFTALDPLAEKYYNLSPYNYAGCDPVNAIDPSGLGWIRGDYGNTTFYFFDSRIHTQKDFNQYYSNTDETLTFIGDNGFFQVNGEIFDLLADGTVKASTRILQQEFFLGNINNGVMVGGDMYTNMESVGRNMYGNYLGPDNPKLSGKDQGDSYAVPPVDWQDFNAWRHDRGYDRAGVSGVAGVMNPSTIKYDLDLAISSLNASQYPSSPSKAIWSMATATLFYNISKWKFYLNPALALWNIFSSK